MVKTYNLSRKCTELTQCIMCTYALSDIYSHNKHINSHRHSACLVTPMVHTYTELHSRFMIHWCCTLEYTLYYIRISWHISLTTEAIFPSDDGRGPRLSFSVARPSYPVAGPVAHSAYWQLWCWLPCSSAASEWQQERSGYIHSWSKLPYSKFIYKHKVELLGWCVCIAVSNLTWNRWILYEECSWFNVAEEKRRETVLAKYFNFPNLCKAEVCMQKWWKLYVKSKA